MDATRRDISEKEPSPWGFWATIGFSCLVILVLLVVQAVVAIAFIVVMKAQHTDMDPHSLGSNGLLLAIATCVSMPPTIAVSLLFAKLRKNITIKEYFCLYKPEQGQYIKWSLATLMLALCSDAVTIMLGRPVLPKFVVDAYTTAHFAPLLWFAMIIAAPLAEETIFRGFVFKGIQKSRIGSIGAILISSVGWAALHTQYDLYGVGTIFVSGLLLGIARSRSNSIYVPILMHALWSLIATIEVAIYMC
jgi:membrane protease YdiL (CAAX protease family)